MRRQTSQIRLALKESVVDERVSSIDESVVIVAKSLSAVEIEDNVTVSVDKEVTARLFHIHEALQLNRLKVSTFV